MLIRRVLVAVALCTVVFAGLRAAADDSADRRLALREAQEPMRDGNWAMATARLLAFRNAHPGTPEAIEAWVLEARAWLEGGQGAAGARRDLGLPRRPRRGRLGRAHATRRRAGL